MLNLNYDKKFDILYARLPFNGHSYGEEDNDGIITYYNIETDAVTGVAIYSFRKRLESGSLSLLNFPFQIDFTGDIIKGLIYS